MSKLCIIMTHRGRSSSLASCACWTRTCLWFSLSTSLLMYLGVKSKPTWTVTEAKRPSSLKTTLQMKARWQKCVAHWGVTSPIATSWSLCVCIKGKAASRSCVKAKKGRAIAWTTKTQKKLPRVWFELQTWQTKSIWVSVAVPWGWTERSSLPGDTPPCVGLETLPERDGLQGRGK